MAHLRGDEGFRWLFDAAVDAMLLADPEGAILARNPSCERLFGYAGEDWAGLTIEDLVPERFRAAHRGFRAAFAATPEPRAMGRGRELYGLRKDRTEFQAAVSLSVLPEADGPVILAIIEDITSLRRAEEALLHSARQLREQEALLGLAVRGTGLAPWEWNPLTDEIYLSPEWKAQLGYADEEVANQATEWRSRLYPDDTQALEAVATEFRSGGRREAETRYRLRHRNGSFRWMQSRGVLLPAADGKGERLLGMQCDVTDQVLMARKLGAWRGEMANLRQVQVALETAAAIAHEINQPLNAVVSFSEAAQQMWRQGKPEKLDYALSGAVAQAGRAGQVVRDLLQFLERRDLPVTSVDLNRVVREAVAVAADDYPGSRIVLALRPELPPVRANEIQIKKVMTNLLRNGAEAMAGAGLSSEPITVTVSTSEDGAMAQVSVRDSGPGLDPATVGRIFEPFFTTKPSGIGMGLATSRRIIERLGGRLWFEPNAGGGATFHFNLPLVA